ncbi:Hypothetical predicted protein [Podarcis lilfordi]|uniref:Uncharacterized protein n=1 Tax=Podarcis lilfordi TaxID=74358 RepID=A0AA35PFG1_9SAUR|nr:Hypothetical predicted protein [Podarcis lilfordi]
MFGCLNFKKSLLLLGRGCEEHFYEGDNSNKQSASVEPSTCLIVRSELVEKTIRKVFSLPSQKLTKLRDRNPRQPAEMQPWLD